MTKEKTKSKVSIYVGLGILGFLLFIGIISMFAVSNTTNIDNIQDDDSVKTNTNIEQPKTPTYIIEETDTATIGEKNALSQAQSYLRYTAFSYSGLIKQLEFEGYSYNEAKYGVDNSGANWNEQAALKAQSYLDYSAFSREGLITQLEFEGFTNEQAKYGVQVVGY